LPTVTTSQEYKKLFCDQEFKIEATAAHCANSRVGRSEKDGLLIYV